MPGPAGDQPAGHLRVRGFGHPHPTAATHGALDGVRALPAKGKNFSFPADRKGKEISLLATFIV